MPGKAADSLIVKAIRHEGDLKMPPKGGKLPASVIADFVKWIDTGAADPRDGSATAGAIDWSKAREFWSFKPVVKPAVPAGAGDQPDRPLHPGEARREGAHARRAGRASGP